MEELEEGERETLGLTRPTPSALMRSVA